MENSKSANEEPKTTTNSVVANDENPNDNNHNTNSSTTSVVEENPNNTNAVPANEIDNQNPQAPATRTPFTSLSQVDADLALARTLQEQVRVSYPVPAQGTGTANLKKLGHGYGEGHERAYMMLTMNTGGSDYASWEAGSYMHEDDDDFDDTTEEEYDISDADYDDEEDAFDVHAHAEAGEGIYPSGELDPTSFPSDEAYARALQDAEEREMAARLLAAAGIHDMVVAEAEEETEDHDDDSQDTSWPEVDPDELSYEELLALGEVVGTESRGLSADTIASLTSMNYKTQSSQGGSSDTCVICRFDYEDDDTLTVLSCKHSYHSECINNWLQINKVCPICSAEVSLAGISSS
ncbi:hypothetical protein LguiA_000851 [Lonicera macranthoides]